MQLWVGLGNPGAKYALHRHNVGFMAADLIAEAHDFGPWSKKFRSLVAEGRLGRHRILLVKPQTFMNDSGAAVREALTFYKLDLDNSTPFFKVYGGTQDNFSLGGPSRTRSENGILNSDWYVTAGGDGFQSRVDPKDPNTVYAESQHGNLQRFNLKTGESVNIVPQEEPADAAALFGAMQMGAHLRKAPKVMPRRRCRRSRTVKTTIGIRNRVVPAATAGQS